MKRNLDLGFIALTDAAPLIVAHELSLFADEGLNVTLHREVSWATIRDKVGAGLYQGAHMLAPMVLAANMGVGSEPAAVVAPLSLNAHGAAIGLSRGLADEMASLDAENPLSAAALAKAVARRREHNEPLIRFAAVFPYSMHAYMLRYWAASAGIYPDRDIRIETAAPTAIAARMKLKAIDGFCVGAPWGDFCASESGAQIVLDSGAFWPGGPDKVLGLSAAWATGEPEAALGVTRAMLRASLWADAPENTNALARLLAQEVYVGAPAALIARRLGTSVDANIRFARSSASFPWRSHAAWILSQMLRWGQITAQADFERAMDCYRPDLFRTAAAAVGLSAPLSDSKIEGAHDGAWALPGVRGPIPMARDSFFEGGSFDPGTIRDYAANFAIQRAKARAGA